MAARRAAVPSVAWQSRSSSRPVTVDEYVHFRERRLPDRPGIYAPDEVRRAARPRRRARRRDRTCCASTCCTGGWRSTSATCCTRACSTSSPALIGPDVLALQTMLFVKGPGSPGQGYHQDSFHIITAAGHADRRVGRARPRRRPRTAACGSRAGSQHEPVYPDADERAGHGGDRQLADIPSIAGADDPDESRNGLTPVAAKYAGREVPAVLDPGDVVFFGGHVLHRSHANRSADALAARLRRPLLQRALLRAVGRRAARGRRDRQRRATSSRAADAPAVRPAEVPLTCDPSGRGDRPVRDLAHATARGPARCRRSRRSGSRALARRQPFARAGAAVPRALEHARRRDRHPQRLAARAGRRRRAARRADARVPRPLPARHRHRPPRGHERVHAAARRRCARSSTASTRPTRPCRASERIAAALGPKMLDLAAERSLGTHPYFTTAEHTRFARERVGPDALVAPELAVVVEPDAESAREHAREYAAALPGAAQLHGEPAAARLRPSATSPTAAATG